MSLPRILFSPSAQQDLTRIRAYSSREWGRDRSKVYVNSLRDAINSLRDNPERGRPADRYLESARRIISGRHAIYYVIGEDRIEILRIYHMRGDVDTALD